VRGAFFSMLRDGGPLDRCGVSLAFMPLCHAFPELPLPLLVKVVSMPFSGPEKFAAQAGDIADRHSCGNGPNRRGVPADSRASGITQPLFEGPIHDLSTENLRPWGRADRVERGEQP